MTENTNEIPAAAEITRVAFWRTRDGVPACNFTVETPSGPQRRQAEKYFLNQNSECLEWIFSQASLSADSSSESRDFHVTDPDVIAHIAHITRDDFHCEYSNEVIIKPCELPQGKYPQIPRTWAGFAGDLKEYVKTTADPNDIAADLAEGKLRKQFPRERLRIIFRKTDQGVHQFTIENVYSSLRDEERAAAQNALHASLPPDTPFVLELSKQ